MKMAQSFLGNKKQCKWMFACLCLCFLTMDIFAQIERGRFTIGGSGDVSISYTALNRNFNLSVAPSFGIFVVKGFVIGGRYSIGIGSARNYDAKNQVYNTTTTFNTQIGPSLKYYLGKKPLKGVTAVNATYVVSTALSKTNVSNANGFSVGGSVGMAYFLNSNISVETAMYLTASGFEKQLPTTRVGFSVGFFAFVDKKKRE
ncbi:MAG: hypothetical protein JWO06_1594 [Bacteroidota bacterium]|nr:hypothetical protein [Bacteroidota bacterium]